MKHLIKFVALLKNNEPQGKHTSRQCCFICGSEGNQYHADECGHEIGVCTKCAPSIEAVGLKWCDRCDPNL